MRAPAGALFLFLATAASSLAAGPSVPPPDFGSPSPGDRAGGEAALGEFRRAVPDQCCYEFELQARPRRGDTHSVPGRLWAGRDDRGPAMRLVLNPGAPDEQRWLIQGGPQPAAWSGAGAAAAQPASLFAPLFPGLEVTAFDLLPTLQPVYLYWPDETLLSVSRLNGRPTYVFLFRPPSVFAAAHPEIVGVRIYLDTQFKGPTRTELLGPGGVARTMTVNDVKLMGEHPAIVKEVDLRNEATRDTTRFEVRAAAVGLDLAPSLFTAEALTEAIAPPRADLMVNF